MQREKWVNIVIYENVPKEEGMKKTIMIKEETRCGVFVFPVFFIYFFTSAKTFIQIILMLFLHIVVTGS